MAEFVANFNLNNNNLDASFDLSEGASFDALFEIYAGSVTWGNILGDITNQTDLQDALDLKASNERIDGIVEAFNDDIESINDSITELSGNLDDLENTVTNNYNELSSAIDSNHQAISNINSTIQSYGDIVSYNAADFATSAQGALADTALQPNDNISELTNDVGYITSASLPIVNNNRITIQKNGSTVGGFTLNQPNDETINLSIPTTAADVGALPNTTTINDLTTTTQQEALNSGANSTNIGQISANAQAIQTETTNRTNADNNLQSQIDALVVSSDVFDIVGTYAELQAYDISTVPVNDIIKVLVDSTHNNAATYYRCVENNGVKSWSYIGSEGAYYTKGEADSTFVPQTRTINGQALSSNINLTASDVGALPDSTIIPTVNNGTLTIQANGTTVGTFTANQSGNTTANIVVPDSATWGNITGTLSNQTDLQNALNSKADSSSIGNGTVTFTQGGVTKGTITMNQSGNTTIAFEQGSSGTITDVEVNGESVVTDGVAEIDLSGYQTKLIAGTDLEKVPLLPSGHTQLKSITATGSQYINTGIWLTDNFKAVIVGRFTDTTGTQCVLGATMPTSAATYKNIVLAKDASRYFVNNGNPWLTNQTNSSAPLDTNRHTFVVEITSSSTKISVDGTTNTGNYGNVTLDEDLFLFARNAVNASPAITDFAKFELETIELYNNDELVFNGVPDKYGNKAGIYDTITSTFMPSLSATDFVAGEEIATQDVINFTNKTGYITGIDSSDVTTALGYTPYNASNPDGYITGISSSDVTTALGYTPYNSTNPNGYITSSALNGYATQTWVGQQGYLTSITSAQITNALGYTPYNSTNPNGYISSASVSSLTDVILTSPTNGQGLVYNSTSQRWENGTVSSTGQVTIKDWTV